MVFRDFLASQMNHLFNLRSVGGLGQRQPRTVLSQDVVFGQNHVECLVAERNGFAPSRNIIDVGDTKVRDSAAHILNHIPMDAFAEMNLNPREK